MPRTGRARRHVSCNIDNQGEQEQNTGPLPKWLTDLTEKQKSSIKTLTLKHIRTSNAVDKLSQHLENGSAPKSLHVDIRLSVSPKYQESIDTTMQNARSAFQKSLIEALINTRRSELADIEMEIEHEKEQWKHLVQQKITLFEGHDIQIKPETVQSAQNEFEKALTIMNQDITIKFLLDESRKEEKRAQLRERTANNQIENALATDQNEEWKREIAKLRSSIKNLQKKEVAKPSKSNAGRGPTNGNKKNTRSRNASPRPTNTPDTTNQRKGTKGDKEAADDKPRRSTRRHKKGRAVANHKERS